jgi:hypothetical protein
MMSIFPHSELSLAHAGLHLKGEEQAHLLEAWLRLDRRCAQARWDSGHLERLISEKRS